MVDKFSKEKRSSIMKAIRSKNTGPEVKLRKVLRARGLRYRVYYGIEKIDIAFPSKKLAVFVDGCFWHGCPLHSHIPKSNKDYWLPKLKRNMERDGAKDERLKGEGWTVMHFWEHEMINVDLTADKIQLELNYKRLQSQFEERRKG
jgi:DNA mismatch endonuclease, patch repair protein